MALIIVSPTTMPDQTPTNTDAPVANEPSQNGNDNAPSNIPETVPYSRLQEKVQEVNELKARLDALEAEKKANSEKAAKEKGEFEKLYNDNLPKIEGYDTLNKTLENMLASEIEQIPEDKRGIIPTDYPPHKQLEWLAKNKSLFTNTAPASKNTPVTPKESSEGVTLHKAADIRNIEYYSKHEADIKKAISEGGQRIVE